MKNRKGYILEKAFDVFMSKGYDSASISVLQKELGMSRGAMYRYFKSKDELFIEIIDVYVLSMIDTLMPKVDEDITIAELIEYLYSYHKKLFVYFEGRNFGSQFLNFTALIIQAAKYYPGFIEKINAASNEGLKLWKRAIVNSIARGEIRDDVDVNILARMFSTGSRNLEDFERGFELRFMQKAKMWKKEKNYLYNLIKK